MNISTLVGICVAIAVIWNGVVKHATNTSIFLDSHAITLVVGGTIAAALIAFPLRDIFHLFKFVVLGVLYPKSRNKVKIAKDILSFTLKTRANGDKPVDNVCHPFLTEGFLLIQKKTLSHEEFRTVLGERNLHFKESYGADAKMLNALAKFPPAFGLLGATTGMIAMMSNLGAGGKDSIGPAMAIALVATFWGIAVANLILLPLADHASKLAKDDSKVREMMMAGMVLLHEGATPSFIYEVMRSYLSIPDRNHSELRQIKSELETVFARDEKAKQDRLAQENPYQNIANVEQLIQNVEATQGADAPAESDSQEKSEELALDNVVHLRSAK